MSATCIITNCRKVARSGEPFCSDHCDQAPTPSNIGDAATVTENVRVGQDAEAREALERCGRYIEGAAHTFARFNVIAAKLSGAGDGLTSEARLLANLFDVDPIKWSGEEVRRLFDLVNAVATPNPPKATCTPPVGEVG